MRRGLAAAVAAAALAVAGVLAAVTLNRDDPDASRSDDPVAVSSTSGTWVLSVREVGGVCSFTTPSGTVSEDC